MRHNNKKGQSAVPKNNMQEVIVPEWTEPGFWKYVFFGLAVVVFACMAFTATKVGSTGDEFLDDLNGQYALAYYTEGDTTFVNYDSVPVLQSLSHILKYYGTGFEIVVPFAVKYLHLPDANCFLYRHLLCALYGFLLFLFTAFITRRITRSWLAATFSLLLISLTPVVFGLSFIASKDIPFATGFAIANYAFLRIFDHLPKFRISDILLSILGIAMAVSIRVGGMMLVMFLVVLFAIAIVADSQKRKMLFTKPFTTLWKSLGVGTLIVVAGSLIGLCFYPNFFYEGPIDHVKNALTLVSKFPQRIPMLWEGRIEDSLNLPDHYLVISFLYTVPLFVFGAFSLFFVNIVREWKKYDRTAILYLLFTFIFPFGYVIGSKANVYDGWRHETFAYSGLIVLAAIGLYETTTWFYNKQFHRTWQHLFPALFLLCCIPTLTWMVKNYKYNYSYYNVLAGDPYLKYDMDYYETAGPILFEWLVKNELKDNHDSIFVSTKNGNVMHLQKHKQYPNIKVEEAAFKSYASTDADYTIISLQFLPKQIIKKYFPPKGTIRTEDIDGHPVAALVKRNKLDSKGIKLVQQGKTKEGLVLLDSAYRYDPDNFGLWFWMGLAYYQEREYEKSIEFFTKDLNMEFNLTEEKRALGYMYNGSSLYELKRYEEAITVLKNAETYCVDQKNMPFIKANMGLAYFADKKYAEAIPYLKECVSAYPFLVDYLNVCNAKAR